MKLSPTLIAAMIRKANESNHPGEREAFRAKLIELGVLDGAAVDKPVYVKKCLLKPKFASSLVVDEFASEGYTLIDRSSRRHPSYHKRFDTYDHFRETDIFVNASDPLYFMVWLNDLWAHARVLNFFNIQAVKSDQGFSWLRKYFFELKYEPIKHCYRRREFNAS